MFKQTQQTWLWALLVLLDLCKAAEFSLLLFVPAAGGCALLAVLLIPFSFFGTAADSSVSAFLFFGLLAPFLVALAEMREIG